MVPVEGIEPPTFGLQNRCSTAELNRLFVSAVTATKDWQSIIVLMSARQGGAGLWWRNSCLFLPPSALPFMRGSARPL